MFFLFRLLETTKIKVFQFFLNVNKQNIQKNVEEESMCHTLMKQDVFYFLPWSARVRAFVRVVLFFVRCFFFIILFYFCISNGTRIWMDGLVGINEEIIIR